MRCWEHFLYSFFPTPLGLGIFLIAPFLGAPPMLEAALGTENQEGPIGEALLELYESLTLSHFGRLVRDEEGLEELNEHPRYSPG